MDLVTDLPAQREFVRLREEYDRKTRSLLGRRIQAVAYYDLDLGRELRDSDWDFGDWHHVVMGLEFTTDRGPVSVVESPTFESYGVEIYATPMSEQFTDPRYIQSWSVTDHDEWKTRIASPVDEVAVAWDTRISETFERVWNKEAKDYQHVPTGLAEIWSRPVSIRLGFGHKPVWLVAAIITEHGRVETALVGGDEIFVIFSQECLASLGFEQSDFDPI